MNDDSAAVNGKCAIHVIAITSVPWSNDIQKENIIHNISIKKLRRIDFLPWKIFLLFIF